VRTARRAHRESAAPRFARRQGARDREYEPPTDREWLVFPITRTLRWPAGGRPRRTA